MKKIILTAGPRGAGKTTFCKKVIELRPEIVLVERDALLIELFGSTMLSPYTGQHAAGEDEMLTRIAKYLEKDDVTLILDTWTGYERERTVLIKKLRSLGASHVVVWYFVTAQDVVVQQFFAREAASKTAKRKSLFDERCDNYRKESCRQDYELYHGQKIEEEKNFDSIVRIDPATTDPSVYLENLL